MSLNASGVRDTARSLHISPTTVLSALKKGSGQIRVHAAHGMNMNLPATLFRPHRGVWIVDCTSRQAYKVCVVMAPRERWS
jgi:hypothetical protein